MRVINAHLTQEDVDTFMGAITGTYRTESIKTNKLNLPQSFDADFCSLIAKLRSEYPATLFYWEGIADDQLDINQVSRSFFKTGSTDCSIDQNSNVTGRNTITYNYEVPKAIMKLNSLHNLWKKLGELYDRETADTAIEAELCGLIYINDAWDIGRPYCFNFSTLDLALNGMKLSSRLDITPPKSLGVFLRQVEQFTVYAANSTLGATGLADLLIVASWYVDRILECGELNFLLYNDHKIIVGDREMDVWRYVATQLESLIYTLNWEFRGNQSPFTNVSIYDRPFLEELLPHYKIDGESPKLETVQKMQREFLAVYNMVLSRNPVTFPVITACLSTTQADAKSPKIADQEFLKMVCEANQEYGFINFYIGETSTISSCCRLRSKADDLGYVNSFGAGSTKIGSVGVVTLNLPQLARSADGDVDAFLDSVASFTHLASCINHAKREFIRDRIERGALPLYTQGYMSLDRQYSTCGFTGLYEALEILDYDILEEDGLAMAEAVLCEINDANDLATGMIGVPHNLEQVPGETSAVKLAKKDTVRGQNSEGYSLYSNQFVPLWDKDADLLDRIRIQGRLDYVCTGGAICHLNLNSKTSVESMMALVELAAESRVIYFALNYTLNKCEKGHITVGHNLKLCPVCNTLITDRFTRVVGFLTNTKHWNATRQNADWPNRKFYGKENIDDQNNGVRI